VGEVCALLNALLVCTVFFNLQSSLMLLQIDIGPLERLGIIDTGFSTGQISFL